MKIKGWIGEGRRRGRCLHDYF